MITISNQKLPIGYTDEDIRKSVSKVLKTPLDNIASASVRKISIDARKKQDVHYVATLDVCVRSGESAIIKKSSGKAHLSSYTEYKFTSQKKLDSRPVVIGAGPAGLFCALLLARNGARPIVIERGECVEKRTKSIDSFFTSGILNTSSNIQFGEGGAGTFSDGKLNTGTKDKRAGFILKEFVAHGAPEEILVSAKPHIGTDKLKIAIASIREEIKCLGGEFMFNTLFTDFSTNNSRINSITIQKNGYRETIDTDTVVLATGHSARDTFAMLKSKGIMMEQKPFSIGARIEHKRDYVDHCQFGNFKDKLPAADYKLSTHLADGRGVYTFCMCPGGYVVNASSEEGMMCTNGMSLFARDAENSNSAVLVSVHPEDYNNGDVLDGIKLQRQIEKNCYNKTGGYIAPVEKVCDFLGTKGDIINNVTPSIKPGFEFTDISDIYPKFISESLKCGLFDLSKKSDIFKDFGAVLTAAETRSSSPVRILRNEFCESVSIGGLYPCGEGAGYAGGIMSAAADGLRCAEQILT